MIAWVVMPRTNRATHTQERMMSVCACVCACVCVCMRACVGMHRGVKERNKINISHIPKTLQLCVLTNKLKGAI